MAHASARHCRIVQTHLLSTVLSLEADYSIAGNHGKSATSVATRSREAPHTRDVSADTAAVVDPDDTPSYPVQETPYLNEPPWGPQNGGMGSCVSCPAAATILCSCVARCFGQGGSARTRLFGRLGEAFSVSAAASSLTRVTRRQLKAESCALMVIIRSHREGD